MPSDAAFKPRLRPLEAVPLPDERDGFAVALRDPTRISDVVLTLSPAALQILAMMDGARTCEQLRGAFYTRFGQPLAHDTLADMLDHLERAYFLEGPAFEAHYDRLLRQYRERGVRRMPQAAHLGLDKEPNAVFAEMLSQEEPLAAAPTPRGVVAPHLDYPRGRPCYATAYGLLRGRIAPDRVVILGTNHFGRSNSVVATGCDFATPLGVTHTDVAFLRRLEDKCGDLTRYELDHVHEHSIELQVAWLQHLFGPDAFCIVPILCPDPCGPAGTAPIDGNGVDLRRFAQSLGELLADDGGDTLVVAGADLSHVGGAFGDERALDSGFLGEVREADQTALQHLLDGDPDRFVDVIARRDNATRMCSAGCIFTLATALREADARLLRYHQAVDEASQTCVTCAALAYS